MVTAAALEVGTRRCDDPGMAAARRARAGSGARAGAHITLDRPPCGPAPGHHRPWEWPTSAEPCTPRERRLAALPATYQRRARAAERERQGR